MTTFKLHGFGVSNYSNVVRTALLEKELDFEEALVPPSQSQEYLGLSPLGKIPCLETEHGPISESLAILEFLEARKPLPPLWPKEAYGRQGEGARADPRLLPRADRTSLYGLLFGKEVAEAVKESIRADLPKVVAAVKRLLRFDPWACGRFFGYADIVLYWTLALAKVSARGNAGIDLVTELGAGAWLKRMDERASVKSVRETEHKARVEMGLAA